MTGKAFHNPSDNGIDMKSDDIVTRLWQYTPEAPNIPMETRLLLNDAANEILRLRAEVARLGTFLHPVGMVINTYGTSLTKRACNET